MTAPAFSAPGPSSVYTGRVTNWPMVALSAAFVAPFLVLGNAGGGNWRGLAVPALVAAAAVVLNVLTASSVRTTAGPNGVTVRFGLLGWPRCTYGIDRIDHAEVVDLLPWQVAYGFWWSPRRTLCTVRSGPTLRLALRTGRTVTVTVPDAPAAVAAIREARAA